MTERSHITVILDRTGSMDTIREDVVGGFNAFLGAQQATPHPATFTLVQFDSQDPYEVLQSAVPLAQARPLTLAQYVPRASTPLYDAMGRGILELEAQLAALPDAQRPTKVIFVVVTDGQENASQEFDRARVSALIQAKKALDWDFVFLSADLDAFTDAGHLGVDADARIMFKKSRQGNERVWASVAEKVSARRMGVAASVAFTDQDRKLQDEAED